MNSGIERAALMISEEKHQQDSRKKITKFIKNSFLCHFQFIFSFESIWRSKSIFVDFYSSFHCYEVM